MLLEDDSENRYHENKRYPKVLESITIAILKISPWKGNSLYITSHIISENKQKRHSNFNQSLL